MTRAAHMIEFAVCTRTNGMEHRAFGMHVGVSLVPTYTLSYMLIFTKQFLCAFDCHLCGVQARPATSRVNTSSAARPTTTTNYCRRDDWDFSLLFHCTPWMTLNFIDEHSANASCCQLPPSSSLQCQLEHVPFYLPIASCILCVAEEKKTHTNSLTNSHTKFHLWLEF